ncbi:hypothetical protein DPMN_090482 [Dreissena polymorpha]|uniref:Uncharacterized protein n=1 Tax=Dreissena polymorpha TaxID=45954 RepID=A0A9D4QZ34_DREPO|nr:hypothetical protein DPMN_090482 [Dreissena polymorpha]
MTDYGLSEAVFTSDSESSSNEDEVEEGNLEGELIEWSVESKISKCNIDRLLAILRKQWHEGLPKEIRTLLQTPREIPVLINVLEIAALQCDANDTANRNMNYYYYY